MTTKGQIVTWSKQTVMMFSLAEPVWQRQLHVVDAVSDSLFPGVKSSKAYEYQQGVCYSQNGDESVRSGRRFQIK